MNTSSVVLVRVIITWCENTGFFFFLFICLHMVLDSANNKHRNNYMHGITRTDLQHSPDPLLL